MTRSFYSQILEPSARAAHTQRRGGAGIGICRMEPLPPRVMWSATPSHITTDLNGGGGADVVLIDRSLPDQAVLRRALEPGGHVILYDGRRDSAADVLARVTRWAETGGATIRSLSLLSHADGGRFELGNEWVTSGTLRETADEWTDLRAVLSPGANINLFGCSLIDSAGTGQSLIDRVARLTGARVFASNDVTGRDGDWVLEASSRGAEGAPWSNPFSVARLSRWDH